LTKHKTQRSQSQRAGTNQEESRLSLPLHCRHRLEAYRRIGQNRSKPTARWRTRRGVPTTAFSHGPLISRRLPSKRDDPGKRGSSRIGFDRHNPNFRSTHKGYRAGSMKCGCLQFRLVLRFNGNFLAEPVQSGILQLRSGARPIKPSSIDGALAKAVLVE
jgi:hypothetical protein